MTKRDEILKKKLQKAKKTQKLNESSSSTPNERKRSGTHFGMMTLDIVKKQKEEAEKEVERLKQEIERLVSISNSNRSDLVSSISSISEKVKEGAAIAEIDPGLIVVNNHDRDPKSLETEEFQRLLLSIKESGQLIPIIVREKDGVIELVAGYRRLNAAKQLGLPIKALIVAADDQDAVVIKAAENHIREDLDPFERARSYGEIINNGILSARQLAKRLGVSPPSISQYARLLNIPEEIRNLLIVEHSEAIPSDEGIKTVLRRKTPKLSSLVKLSKTFSEMSKDQIDQAVSKIQDCVSSQCNTEISSKNPDKRIRAIQKIIEEITNTEPVSQKETITKATPTGKKLAQIVKKENKLTIKLLDLGALDNDSLNALQTLLAKLGVKDFSDHLW